MRAIPGWVRQGVEPREIAEVLGTTVPSLHHACSKRGVSLNPLAYAGGVGSLAASLRRELGGDAWNELRREAQARSIPVAQLAVDVLRLVALDGLCSAVLDSEEDEA